MAKQTLKSQTLLFSVFFFLTITAVSVATCSASARRSFKNEAGNSLERLASLKALQFQSNLNSEITLVLHMCRSPVIKEAMRNPNDKAAFAAALREFNAYQNSFLGKNVFWVSAADLRFYSDMKYSYTINPDNPNDYWYKMTMFETDVYNFNINYNPELKKTMLWLNAVIREDDNGTYSDGTKPPAIAMAGTGIPLTGFIDQMYNGLDSSVAMYLYNDKLEITGAADKDILDKKEKITKMFPELSQAKPSDKIQHLSTKKGEYVLQPVSSIGWTIVLFTPYSPLVMFSWSNLYLPLILIGATLLIIIIFDIFIFRILRTMTSVIAKTEEEAQAQLEFIEEVSQTMQENVASLDSFGTLMSNQIEQMNECVQMTSDLTEKQIELDKLRSSSMRSTTDLNSSSKKGTEHLSTMTEKIAQLSEAAKKLTDANALISGITERTNLLAMNASIEASHAGAQGAGFAVVAKEIRALAEKSRDRQKEVVDSVNKMTEMVSSIVEYTKTAKSSFDEIGTNTASVQENFGTMSRNLEDEGAMGKTISTNLSALTAGVSMLSEQFASMRSENSALAAEVERASEGSQELVQTAEASLAATGMGVTKKK